MRWVVVGKQIIAKGKIEQLDQEAEDGTSKPYSTIVKAYKETLERKYNTELELGMTIKDVSELGTWQVWDVQKKDGGKWRFSHVPFVYQWDVCDDGKGEEPLPEVYFREVNNYVINGKVIAKDLVDQGGSRKRRGGFVAIFRLKKELSGEKRKVVRIIYIDGPGGGTEIGSNSTLSINYTVGLTVPGIALDDSEFTGRIKRNFSKSLFRKGGRMPVFPGFFT